MSKHKAGLILFGFSTISAVLMVVNTWGRPENAFTHLTSGAYFYSLALVIVWSLAVANYFKKQPAFAAGMLFHSDRASNLELLFPWFIAGVIALSVKASINYSTGEMHALGVAKSMAFNKAIWINYFPPEINFIFPTAQHIDIKPYLFPFLLSIFHTFLGLRDGNVFVLNFLLMGFCLSAVYLCTRRMGSSLLACTATLFLASCPLFSSCGRSSSYDLLASAFIGIIFINLYLFMKNRRTEEFALLWMNLLMLANVREESPIYFAMIILFLFALRYIKVAHLKESLPLIGLTPILVLPLIWQRMVFDKTSFGAMDTNPLFGWSHFKLNAGIFIRNQWDPTFQLPYPFLLHLVGFLIFAYLLIDVFVRRLSFQLSFQKHFILIIYSCLGFHLLLHLAFWWTNTYIDPVSFRYFLPFTMVLSLSPIFWAATREKFIQRLPPLLFLLSISMFLLYHPVAVEGAFLYRHPLNVETPLIYEFLGQQPDRRILLIAEFPWRFSTMGWKAIDFETADQQAGIIQGSLRNLAIREAYVVQDFPNGAGQPKQGQELNTTFDLEPVVWRPMAQYGSLKISRIRSIHPAPPSRTKQ